VKHFNGLLKPDSGEVNVLVETLDRVRVRIGQTCRIRLAESERPALPSKRSGRSLTDLVSFEPMIRRGATVCLNDSGLDR
jgi:hypothetical protein